MRAGLPSLLSSVCIEFEAWGSGETEFLPAAYEVLRSSRRIRCTSSGVPPGARALDLYSVLLKEVIAEECRLLAKCRTLVGRNSVCLRL
jgi:hypothetical protein